MSIEELLVDTGGFGRFQLLIVLTLFYNKLSVAWSMLQMSFAGYIPDWHCSTVALGFHGNGTVLRDNTTEEACTVNNTWTNYRTLDCHDFQFDESVDTVITEWDLLCDKKHIKSLLTSIQMAGVLVGAFVSGQLGDFWGRKKTTYVFVLFHAVMNIVTAFSVSWEMFAAGRFLVGIGIGALLVMVFSYPMEFLPVKWRPLLSVLPLWATGVAIFAGGALLMGNWRHLHIACGVVGLPGLVGYLYVPESMRWLTVQGRLKEAEEVCQKIASVNGKEMPSKAKALLENVYQEELEARQSGKKYSYVDVFRGWATCKITLTFCFFWMSMSLIYYGISFGVSSLAGNIYFNIFLLAVVEVPVIISTFFFMNKIGRKWTTGIMLLVSLAGSLGCLLTHFFAPSDVKGGITTGLSLFTKMGVGAAWAVMQTWGVEVYPTVTRVLGYGAANTSARIGGILAPFVIDFDYLQVMSYSIIVALIVIDVILTIFTPETKGQELPDTLDVKDKPEGKPQTNGRQLKEKAQPPESVKASDIYITAF